MDRDPNERVNFTLRLPEYIRAVLEETATESGTSLNSIIVQILRDRIHDPVTALPKKLFGRADISNILSAIYLVVVQAEIRTGGNWLSDDSTFDAAVQDIQTILEKIQPSSSLLEEDYDGSGLQLAVRVASDSLKASGGGGA